VDYNELTKPIESFGTVERFWQVYDHIVRPNDFKTSADYHLFREGIKPTWEDPQNNKGGKWMLRLKTKGLTSRYWEELVLAMVGEQFDVGQQEVCGAVVSVRHNEDIISVWNKNADNIEATTKIRDQMKKVLSLPPSITIEYKKHVDAKADGSSFRNPSLVYKVPVGEGRGGSGGGGGGGGSGGGRGGGYGGSGGGGGGRGFGGGAPGFGGRGGGGGGARQDSREGGGYGRDRGHEGWGGSGGGGGKSSLSSGDPIRDRDESERRAGWGQGGGGGGGGGGSGSSGKSGWGTAAGKSSSGQAASGALGPPKAGFGSAAGGSSTGGSGGGDKTKDSSATASVWARGVRSSTTGSTGDSATAGKSSTD